LISTQTTKHTHTQSHPPPAGFYALCYEKRNGKQDTTATLTPLLCLRLSQISACVRACSQLRLLCSDLGALQKKLRLLFNCCKCSLILLSLLYLCIGHRKMYGSGSQTHMHTHIIFVITWSRQSDDSVAQRIQSDSSTKQTTPSHQIQDKAICQAINKQVIKVTRVCTLLPSDDLSRSSSRNRSRSRYSKTLILRPFHSTHARAAEANVTNNKEVGSEKRKHVKYETSFIESKWERIYEANLTRIMHHNDNNNYGKTLLIKKIIDN